MDKQYIEKLITRLETAYYLLQETKILEVIASMIAVGVMYGIIIQKSGISREVLIITTSCACIGLMYFLIKVLIKRIDKLNEILDEVNTESYSEKDIELVAYHEAAHAIVSKLTSKAYGIKNISIIGNKQIGGEVTYYPKTNFFPKSEYLASIQVELAGMVVEQIVYKQHSSGCARDLEIAKQNAFKMLEDLAMGNRFIYGESRKAEIEEEVEKILQEQKFKTELLLRDHILMIEDLKNELLKKRFMDKNEVEEFFQKYEI